MAEHMVCNHGVRGSSPLTSTIRVARLAIRATLTCADIDTIVSRLVCIKKASVVSVLFDNRIGKIPNR